MFQTHYNFKFISNIEQIKHSQWDELAKSAGPFLQYNFLHALENSKSVCLETGWQPQHLVIYQEKEVIGILPLYIKTHSYGEYVFDFAWANTFRQYGLNYYPKLVSAVPFTPVTGNRLLLKDGIDRNSVLQAVCTAIQQKIKSTGLSSMHWLFVEQSFSAELAQQKQLSRRSVQFQWFNHDYQDFSDYLSYFNSRKRKSVKNEREKVADAGITTARLSGNDINQESMDFFYRCYQQTYLKRSGHEGYLNKAFFAQLLKEMSDNILLVTASQAGEPVASALFLFDQKQLCGRYWGALKDINGLHFECCYYQGIEFCIEHAIASFNPGTQGEHKLLRGFEPIYCYSNHWINELAFHHAVERFIEQEAPNIDLYRKNAQGLLPFKKKPEKT
ncbi:MAG: putative N-acyltransferase [Paraglaciecola sp.]|jgi:predicted N-acyltransferase